METRKVLPVMAVLSLFAATQAECKVLEQYQAHYQVASASSTVGDWHCRVAAHAGFHESLKDEKGSFKSRAIDLPIELNGRDANQSFDKPKASSERQIGFRIDDECTRSDVTYSTVTTVNADGSTSVSMQPQYNTYHAKMEWRCVAHDPQGAVHAPLACQPAGSMEADDSSYRSQLQAHFNAQNPSMTLNYAGTRESYAYDNCNGNISQRRVIQLSQGVRGHIFENDFRFGVTVNGRPLMRGDKPWELSSRDGLIDEEVSYCPRPGEDPNKLVVKVEAIENGWLWNAHYRSQNQAQLGVESGKCSDVVVLKRFNPLGERWLSTLNQVHVAINREPASENANRSCVDGLSVNESQLKLGGERIGSELQSGHGNGSASNGR